MNGLVLGGIRVGLLLILVGGRKENELWGISGFFGGRGGFLTSISLQGEPGESGSPGVQGEPGVKVSDESSEAPSPIPFTLSPTFPVTSWSWKSSAARGSVPRPFSTGLVPGSA